MLNFTRRLIGARRASSALKTGDVKILDLAKGVLGFERHAPDEQLVCLFNLTREEAEVNVAQGAGVVMAINEAAAGGGGQVKLSGFSGVILRLDM
jgi:alpha-glucosidase